jgi:hypothetical protein
MRHLNESAKFLESQLQSISVGPKSLASFSHDSLADFSFALVRALVPVVAQLVRLPMVFSIVLQAPVPVVPVWLLVLVAARLQDSQSVLAFLTPHLILRYYFANSSRPLVLVAVLVVDHVTTVLVFVFVVPILFRCFHPVLDDILQDPRIVSAHRYSQ